MTSQSRLMPSCRTCGATLDSDARFCRRCGTPVAEMSTPVQPAPSLHLSTSDLRKFRSRLLSVAPLAGLVIFALYVLGQSAIQTEAHVMCTDDKWYWSILMGIRADPTAYYSVAADTFHQIYSPYSHPVWIFPLIFYMWLLVPNVGDLKWLYFLFAMAASIASYFAVTTVTKQRFVAALSAAWIACFLRTSLYLMLECWAITVFLIGLAFFVSERHVPAAAAMGVATLFKQTFAPFMLVASIYYVSCSILRAVMKGSHAQELVRMLADGVTLEQLVQKVKRMRCAWKILLPWKGEAWTKSNKKGAVWGGATFVVGLAYLLNALVGWGPWRPLSFYGLSHVLPAFVGFDPSMLPLFLSGAFDPYLLYYPPLPLVLAVGSALIGMSALANWDQRVIAYASYAFMILVMLTTPREWMETFGWPQRYIAMSVTLVNLFWLVGLHKILQYPVRWVLSLRTVQQTSRWR